MKLLIIQIVKIIFVSISDIFIIDIFITDITRRTKVVIFQYK